MQLAARSTIVIDVRSDGEKPVAPRLQLGGTRTKSASHETARPSKGCRGHVHGAGGGHLEIEVTKVGGVTVSLPGTCRPACAVARSEPPGLWRRGGHGERSAI